MIRKLVIAGDLEYIMRRGRQSVNTMRRRWTRSGKKNGLELTLHAYGSVFVRRDELVRVRVFGVDLSVGLATRSWRNSQRLLRRRRRRNIAVKN